MDPKQPTLISELHPLLEEFTLIAKVLSKSDLRNLKSGKEDGMVFSVELADSSGRIRAVAFDGVAKDFHPMLETGVVYRIGGVKVKQTLWKKSESKYELLVKRGTTFEKMEGVRVEVFQEGLPVTLLADLSLEIPSANVLAVVRSVSESIVRDQKIKTVEIVDASEMGCLLTIWGSGAEAVIKIGDVLLVKGANTSKFDGLTLSTSLLSTVTINPPESDIASFQEQWEPKKSRMHEFPLIGAIERRRKVKTLDAIETGGTLKACIESVLIDRKMTFVSKRTNQLEIVLKMAIKDQAGATSMISVFDPHAKELLSRSPQEIKELQEDQNLSSMKEVLAQIEGKLFYVDVTKKGSDMIGKNFALAA